MDIFLFKLKLLSSLSYFLSILFFSITKKILKTYKILISLYIFLFLQLLLAIFKPQPIIKSQELINYESYATTVNQSFNLDQVNTYQIEFKKEEITLELEKYNNKTSEEKTYPPHRDQLINLSLINLALNKTEAFKDFAFKAKQLDPNWVGWKE